MEGLQEYYNRQTCVWQGQKKQFQKNWNTEGELMKQCVLYDRECIDCGECDRCDLDPNKICDNCMKCVNGDQQFRSILIDRVIAPQDSPQSSPPES